MSMVINTNIQATRTHNVYNKNNDYMNQALTRVATGQKINSAKDGAANWAISEKMRERIRANDQANQNVQNDTALLKTAQGGIDNTIDILKTLKERALNSANDSNINTDRSAIATEVYQLLEQMDDNAAKVKFNGRTLLNGDFDNGAADMFPVADTTSATATSANITPPKVAENPNALATNAVYRIEFGGTNLQKYDATANSNAGGLAAATGDGTDLLVDLVNEEAVVSDPSLAKYRYFQDGDVVQLNWKEDGVEKQKSVTVTNTMSVSDLANKLNEENKATDNSLKIAYMDATAANLKDEADNEVKDSGNATLQNTDTYLSTGAGTAGIYVIGDKGVKITDFSVSVLRKDNDGVNTTNLAAQNLLEISGGKQSQSPKTGSHAVYAVEGTLANVGSGTDPTSAKFADITINSNKISEVNTNASNITFTFGTGDDAVKVTFKADSTINQAKEAFAKEGITVKFLNAGDELYDSEDNVVTKNGLDGAEPLKSTSGGMYFVNESGKELGNLTIDIKNGTTPKKVLSQNASGGTAGTYKVDQLQGQEGLADNALAAKSLSFHIGGEANFYMDINIKEMTTQSLLGADSKTFATMFTDKATARDAVGIIDTAIQTALNENTKLGAMESRLGYTSDNITTMNENLEAADSVYRDSDIAKEMTNYMKYTVLAQSSQYMLAQTSQNAFSVLNLLQA